jgi:hypothetical protein
MSIFALRPTASFLSPYRKCPARTHCCARAFHAGAFPIKANDNTDTILSTHYRTKSIEVSVKVDTFRTAGSGLIEGSVA